MLIDQVDRAITVIEKNPVTQGMFIFDNTLSHIKLPEDALNDQKMNVKDGGKQPLNFMKDTYINGVVRWRGW